MEIEHELCLGRFIRYRDMYDFVRHLEQVEEKLTALVADGEAERAVGLYEAFLAGCYEKIEECDDSGANLSMFWNGLFCGWCGSKRGWRWSLPETGTTRPPSRCENEGMDSR
jgi:hypothetical protein